MEVVMRRPGFLSRNWVSFAKVLKKLFFKRLTLKLSTELGFKQALFLSPVKHEGNSP
jgi:hypothetical protein